MKALKGFFFIFQMHTFRSNVAQYAAVGELPKKVSARQQVKNSPRRKVRGMEFFWSGEEKAWGDPVTVFQYLKG